MAHRVNGQGGVYMIDDTIASLERRVKELEMCKRHHQCELRKGLNCGIREFGIGLVTGLFIGLIFLRAFGRI